VHGSLDPFLDTTEHIINSGDVAGTVIAQFQTMYTAVFQCHGVSLLQRLETGVHGKSAVFADLCLGIVRLDKTANCLHQSSSSFLSFCVHHTTNTHGRESVCIGRVVFRIVLHVLCVMLNELLLLLNLFRIFVPDHVFQPVPLVSPAVSGCFQLGYLNVQFHLLF